MNGHILPFRRAKARGNSGTSPRAGVLIRYAGQARNHFVETVIQRDRLVSGFLELRDRHLPRMSRADRRAMQALDHFMLYGGLSESGRALEANLQVVDRMLERYRKPPSRVRAFFRRLDRWLWEVNQP